MSTTTKTPSTEVNPVVKYFREVRSEFNKVTWPSREETQKLTAVVLAVTIAFALFLDISFFS